MKNKSYFSTPIGLKADLERHKEEELELLHLLANEDDLVFRRTYKALLNKLDASKAELTTKIGRNKP